MIRYFSCEKKNVYRNFKNFQIYLNDRINCYVVLKKKQELLVD